MNAQASIRGAKDAPYPGWLAHDGAAMPVTPASQPGVAFRNGWRVPPGHYSASHWLGLGRDFWRHAGGPLDIVAFLPSYRSHLAARWRKALCGMISERFGNDPDGRINEQLADDILALLNPRETGDAIETRLDLSDMLRLR